MYIDGIGYWELHYNALSTGMSLAIQLAAADHLTSSSTLLDGSENEGSSSAEVVSPFC